MTARHRKCVEELTTEPVLHQEHRSAQSVPRTRVEQFLVKRPPTIVRSTLVLTKNIFPYLKFEVHYLTGRFEDENLFTTQKNKRVKDRKGEVQQKGKNKAVQTEGQADKRIGRQTNRISILFDLILFPFVFQLN